MTPPGQLHGLGLADTRRSPLCNTINHLTQLPIQWNSERWLLLHLIGALVEQGALALHATTVVLQLSRCLFDICDRRLARPPHSLAPICLDTPAPHTQPRSTHGPVSCLKRTHAYLLSVNRGGVIFLSRGGCPIDCPCVCHCPSSAE